MPAELLKYRLAVRVRVFFLLRRSSMTYFRTRLRIVSGENTIIIVAGANNDLSPRDVEEAEVYIKKAKVVVFQFETPLKTTIRALEICTKYNC